MAEIFKGKLSNLHIFSDVKQSLENYSISPAILIMSNNYADYFSSTRRQIGEWREYSAFFTTSPILPAS